MSRRDDKRGYDYGAGGGGYDDDRYKRQRLMNEGGPPNDDRYYVPRGSEPAGGDFGREPDRYGGGGGAAAGGGGGYGLPRGGDDGAGRLYGGEKRFDDRAAGGGYGYGRGPPPAEVQRGAFDGGTRHGDRVGGYDVPPPGVVDNGGGFDAGRGGRGFDRGPFGDGGGGGYSRERPRFDDGRVQGGYEMPRGGLDVPARGVDGPRAPSLEGGSRGGGGGFDMGSRGGGYGMGDRGVGGGGYNVGNRGGGYDMGSRGPGGYDMGNRGAGGYDMGNRGVYEMGNRGGGNYEPGIGDRGGFDPGLRGGPDIPRGGYDGGNRGGIDVPRGGYDAGHPGGIEGPRGGFDVGGRGGAGLDMGMRGAAAYDGNRGGGGYDGGMRGFDGGNRGAGGFDGGIRGVSGGLDGGNQGVADGPRGFEGRFEANRGFNGGRGGFDSGRGPSVGGSVGSGSGHYVPGPSIGGPYGPGAGAGGAGRGTYGLPASNNRGGPYGGGNGAGPYGPSSAGGGGTGDRNEGGKYGQGGGGKFGGGGRSRGPDPSKIDSVLTNILPATVTENFSFYLYAVDTKDSKGNLVDSRGARKNLFEKGIFDGLLADKSKAEKEDWSRVLFFAGSFFFAARPVPGLEPEKLPFVLCDDSQTGGDVMTCVNTTHFGPPLELTQGIKLTETGPNELSFDGMRCADCSKTFADVESMLQHCRDASHSPVYAKDEYGTATHAPTLAVFVSYVNMALQRAMGERLAKWGSEYIDPKSPLPGLDRKGNDLGVTIFEAYSCNFGFIRASEGMPKTGDKPTLALTVDLRAKVIRKNSVLDSIHGDDRGYSGEISPQRQIQFKSQWIGEVVIYKNDRKCYTVTDLDFDNSANSLMIPGKNISHAEYFASKGVKLEYPDLKPMVAVLGRQKRTIYFPAELVTGNELNPRVREQLPMIASFDPAKRNSAIEKIKEFLVPGGRKGAGDLLPAIGVTLKTERLSVRAKVLSLPAIQAAGIPIPSHKGENWAPLLSRANFNVDPRNAVELNVVLFHHSSVNQRDAMGVYTKIRDMVNVYNTQFRFSTEPVAVIPAGDNENHWEEVERFFSFRVPENVFVLDFTRPRGSQDPAYPVIKRILAASGYLSQFVNFKANAHDNPKNAKRSTLVLQGVARQCLQKAGARLWWVKIPEHLPLPAVFIGVDIFHAPMTYDPQTKKRGRKASCAAIIVQVVRNGSMESNRVEMFTKTYKRQGGEEYALGQAMRDTISEALSLLDVKPASAVVWRDGIPEGEFEKSAQEEIDGVRQAVAAANTQALPPGALAPNPPVQVPLSYIVCQKRIATKLLTKDGKYGAPPGTMVKEIQGLRHQTFYINGRAPPFSTPKPVRFIVVAKDEGFENVPLEELTWTLTHDYPNWTGNVKVPSVCQLAHKLAELAGSLNDCGETINSRAFTNTIHFL